MIRPLAIALLCAVMGCKGSQQVVTPVESSVNTEPERPTWVRSRPMSDAFYVGIGLANKARPDFQEAAKKNALNDLASEISVTVEGNSLLYTLDQRGRFDESFTGTIKTRTSEQLEGFEVMGTWENNSEYWMYYRLSKSEHARIKAERKAKAIGNATDLYMRATASLASGDVRSAFDQDLRALLAMRDYWGENDMVEVEGRSFALINEIYNDLQRLTSGIQLSFLPERCALDYHGSFRREMLISAKHRSDDGYRDLAQLPLVISWPGNTGKVTETKNTDASGHVRTTVQRVELNASPREIKVRLDMDALVSKEHDAALIKPLVSSLTVPDKVALIDVEMPRIHMRATETNLGQAVNDAGVAMAIREELTKKGFRFVDRESESDLILTLNSTTRQGGESNGFFTTYLDVSYSFRDRRSAEVVHEGGQQGVKGVQLDHARAGMDAYKRAIQDIRRDLVPAMMDAML